MKRIYYNKLIRDAIPEKIKKAGADFEVYELDEKKFEEELIKKVEEEASGMQSAENREELIKEMADVIDVIEEIKSLKDISDEDIANQRDLNSKKKGGFKKKLFLVWSGDDGYKTNEIRR